MHVPVAEGNVRHLQAMRHGSRRKDGQGGMLVVTVPIHSHGDKLFVVADYAGIRRCFGDGWADVEFEDWRRDPTPLPPSFPQEWEIEELRKMIPLPTPVNDWLLEIRARKKL